MGFAHGSTSELAHLDEFPLVSPKEKGNTLCWVVGCSSDSFEDGLDSFRVRFRLVLSIRNRKAAQQHKGFGQGFPGTSGTRRRDIPDKTLYAIGLFLL